MENKNTTQLYAILRCLSRQMHRFSHKAEHKQGLYHGQYKLLQIVAQNAGIVQRDLAEQMDMRPPSMTEAIGRMEQLNLIMRRQDEKDQRLMHMYLTDEGKKIVKATFKSEEEFTNALFKGLTQDEIDNMLTITTKLCDSLDTLNSEEPDDCEEEGCGHHHQHYRDEKSN